MAYVAQGAEGTAIRSNEADEQAAIDLATATATGFRESKAGGANDAQAAQDAMWIAMGAASALCGPYGPAVVAVAKFVFDNLPRASGSPPPPPGEPMTQVEPWEGWRSAGVWFGPLTFFYAGLPPAWFAREAEALGIDPVGYWAELRDWVKIDEWREKLTSYRYSMLNPNRGERPGWETTDEPRVMRAIVAAWPPGTSPKVVAAARARVRDIEMPSIVGRGSDGSTAASRLDALYASWAAPKGGDVGGGLVQRIADSLRTGEAWPVLGLLGAAGVGAWLILRRS
jgi:hypothetical protein